MDGKVEACACRDAGATLGVLADVQRAYEQRLELIERVGGKNKLQLQIEALRAWVDDLVGQNTLLARAVQELETEATSRLLLDRNKHAEVELELRAEVAALRRRLARKESDLRGLVEVLRRLREFDYCTLEGIHFFEVTESDIFGTVQWRQKKMEQGDNPERKKSAHAPPRMKNIRRKKSKRPCNARELMSINESLQKEIVAKEREIRRLNKDVQTYEQTIVNLRNEMSTHRHRALESPKKDAEVMAGMCCANTECGDLDGANYSELLKEEAAKYQNRIRKMEHNLKCSGENVRALRKINGALSEEMHALRRVCAALDEQCRAAATRTAFKDDIIREMRRQLKQAKAKLRETDVSTKDRDEFGDKLSSPCRSLESMALCAQPRRRSSYTPAHTQSQAPLHPDSDDCRSPRLDGSGDEAISS